MVNNINLSSNNHSQDWQVVLRQSNGKVVLYHSNSNQLSVHHHSLQTSYHDPQRFQPRIENNHNHHTENNDDRSLKLFSNSNASELVSKQHRITRCPLCLQTLNLFPLPSNADSNSYNASSSDSPSHSSSTPFRKTFYQSALPQPPTQPKPRTVTQPAYFNLLSQTNTPMLSQPITPIDSSSPRHSHSSISSFDSLRLPPVPSDSDLPEPLGQEKRVDGYYERFFVEVTKLGRGQKGSVFLCTHTLDGNPLGHYAVKKIAIGQSSPELLQVLSEVKFLESLRHPNIAQYHHAWIEKAQLSRFGPKVPVLYVLMDFANGGTLDDYISLRRGSKPRDNTSFPSSEVDEDLRRRNRRKERFRKEKTRQTGIASGFITSLSPWKFSRSNTNPVPIESPAESIERAVHLFGLDEILHVFEDTCRGLDFLHSKGILHHDLKTENVLLHWESEDAMIPTALISDFGSSISQSENWSRERTGRTGTLDWVPPESLKQDPKSGKLYEVTQKGDLWQLGLLLHCLCFFKLPYTQSDDIDLLKDEIIKYPGFLMDENVSELGDSNRIMNLPDVPQFSRSDLPRSLIKLLSDLLCLDPRLRPSCSQVLRHLEKVRELDINDDPTFAIGQHSKRPHHGIHSSGTRLASKRTRISEETGLSPSVSLNSRNLSLVQRQKTTPKTKDSRTRLSDSSLEEEANGLIVLPGFHRPAKNIDHNHRLPTVGDDKDDQIAEANRPYTLESVKSSQNSSMTHWSHVASPARRTKSLYSRGPPLSQASVARGIAVSVCLKSMIFIQFIKTQDGQSTQVSPASSTTTATRNIPPSSSQADHYYDFMILIVLNTWELLIGNTRFSIGLTVFQSIFLHFYSSHSWQSF